MVNIKIGERYQHKERNHVWEIVSVKPETVIKLVEFGDKGIYIPKGDRELGFMLHVQENDDILQGDTGNNQWKLVNSKSIRAMDFYQRIK